MISLKTSLCLFVFGFCLISLCSGFTHRLDANEEFCFLKNYRAKERFTATYIVSGFHESKVSALVHGPSKTQILYENELDKEGHFDLFVREDGEYSACFTNHDSDENYVTIVFYEDQETGITPVTTFLVDQFGYFLNQTFDSLHEINVNLYFQRTREAIHDSNIETLESRISWSAFFKVFALVFIALGQVFLLTGYLAGKQRNMV